MPVPLPPNTFPVGTTLHKAYDACLGFERRAFLDSGPRPSPLICARLLGNMLLHAPVETGRDHIAGEIVACANDDCLKELGEFYDHHLIRLFKSAKGPTPSPSLHSSKPSFDDVKEALKHELEVTPKNHSAAKAKALARDNYRCIVTGHYDYGSAKKFPSIAERAITEGTVAIDTQAAHIFPASTNKGVVADKGDPKTEYAASVWAVVDRFGGVKLTEELNGPDIHRIENVMTLGADVHSKFDRLNIWFEETGMPNTYRVCGDQIALLGLPSTTTFTTTDPRFSLPDPRYLRVHAACAKIAHLSGAGECIDRIIRDLEDTQVLASDGSSAHLLNYALMNRVQAVF